LGKGDIKTFSEEATKPVRWDIESCHSRGLGTSSLPRHPDYKQGWQGTDSTSEEPVGTGQVCCHPKVTELAGKGACLQGGSYAEIFQFLMRHS